MRIVLHVILGVLALISVTSLTLNFYILNLYDEKVMHHNHDFDQLTHRMDRYISKDSDEVFEMQKWIAGHEGDCKRHHEVTEALHRELESRLDKIERKYNEQ